MIKNVSYSNQFYNAPSKELAALCVNKFLSIVTLLR
jgi:hypothetical protein